MREAEIIPLLKMVKIQCSPHENITIIQLTNLDFVLIKLINSPGLKSSYIAAIVLSALIVIVGAIIVSVIIR